ncbi:hypothetical protein D5S17_09215 [Pseudonocardiaceae bacterium YIM PH 21723]|nr:hypothetical protein D5S17_09215 [Pseudonocardiaceae bacterium YIM PH 21723]
MNKTKTYVVVSDTQIPYHDRKATAAVIRFIGAYQPDHVVQIGDLMDYPQPSRWSKDTRAEFEGSIFEDSELAKQKFLAPLREVFSGPVGVIEGNHDSRPRDYLAKYAPALAESHAFDLPVLLDFQRFEVELLPDFYRFADGWVMCHGHKGGISLARTAGSTALNAARKFGVSVICGHTHRLGQVHHTTGYDARITSQLTGVEVGHLMDMSLAGYLKRATANWQSGFALVHVTGEHVHVQTIPITDGKFTVDAITYSITERNPLTS